MANGLKDLFEGFYGGGPRVVLLDKTVAGGGDTIAQFLRLDQLDDGIGEGLGGVADQEWRMSVE